MVVCYIWADCEPWIAVLDYRTPDFADWLPADSTYWIVPGTELATP